MKKDLGRQFIDWLISPEGQKAIAAYKIDGQQLFYPNASDHKRVTRHDGIMDHCKKKRGTH